MRLRLEALAEISARLAFLVQATRRAAAAIQPECGVPGPTPDSKTDAEKLATDIRSRINAGTFERVTDRRVREQREAAAAQTATDQTVATSGQRSPRSIALRRSTSNGP